MKHPLHLVHASHGRLRISVPTAKGNTKAMEDVRHALTAVHGVRSVTSNDSIGSVTVHYEHHHHANLKKVIAESLPSPQRPAIARSQAAGKEFSPHLDDLSHVDTLLEKEVEFLAAHSHSAQALFETVNQIDNQVKKITGNAVDLKVLAPLALAAGAFLELGVGAATPVWLTLSLFSFNHFIELHTPHPDSAQPQPRKPRRKTRRYP